MAEFYVLKSPRADSPEDKEAGTEFFHEEGYNRGEPPRCEVCGQFTRMLRWLPPYRAELEVWGRHFGDLVFGSADDLLVSQRFKELYEQSGLTGLGVMEPVEIIKVARRRRSLGDPPPYFKATVSLGRTAIDVTASGFEWEQKPACEWCRIAGVKRYKRLVIEAGSWSGEDIFVARGLLGTFITSGRFRHVCEANNVKGAIFIPAENYAHDFYPWETGAQGKCKT